jgi:VanZ family protein
MSGPTSPHDLAVVPDHRQGRQDRRQQSLEETDIVDWVNRMKGLLRHASLWLPPLVYMTLIFHFSSQSQPLPLLTEHVWDKALHLTEYAGLCMFLCRAFRGEGLGWTVAIPLALAAASAYGASDEWHQSFVPLRDADIRDWFADTVGATFGAAVYRVGMAVEGLTSAG